MAGIEPFELSVDAMGKLKLCREGMDDAADVRVRRAFPWSSADRNISIRSAEGKELLLIDDLSRVEPAQRDLIERWLTGHSFIPRIERVERVDVRFGYQQWNVQTDRGAVEFRVQEREDVRFLPDGRFSIKDADGNIYEMSRLEELDERSRRAIEPLL